jgi:Tol biopolymer transport system component
LPSTQVDSSPQFSPDGKWLAFVSNRSGFNEIWRSDSAGQNPILLTSLGRENRSPGSPRWSPDASRIVFDARDAAHSNIYVVGAEGGPVHSVTGWPADQVRPRWSRDGKWIYFASTYPSRWTMWKVPGDAVDITRERAQLLTPEKGFEPEESPDGSRLIFFRPTVGLGVGQLFSVPLRGGPTTRVMDDPVNHGWWALGRSGVYFAGITPGKPVNPPPGKDRPIEYYDFATHRVSRLGMLPGPVQVRLPDFCISPDERRVVYAQVESSTNIMLIEPVR